MKVSTDEDPDVDFRSMNAYCRHHGASPHAWKDREYRLQISSLPKVSIYGLLSA